MNQALKELKFLADFTQWMDVNSAPIYASRPWKVYGEGPSTQPNPNAAVRAQGFNEGRTRYSAQDFRFIQKDGTLYAYAMGWPADGQYHIASLATGSSLAPGFNSLGQPGLVILGEQGMLTDVVQIEADQVLLGLSGVIVGHSSSSFPMYPDRFLSLTVEGPVGYPAWPSQKPKPT